jgi:hypothetical protein
MNDATLYQYRLSGRRPMTFFGLAVFFVMAATGIIYTAPWYFMAPVGMAGAMLIWAIAANPQSGSELTRDKLTYFYQGKTSSVHMADVVHMKVSRWSDGPDTVALTLRSGEVVHVPSVCADSKLAVALKDMGVSEKLG